MEINHCATIVEFHSTNRMVDLYTQFLGITSQICNIPVHIPKNQIHRDRLTGFVRMFNQ